MDIGLLNPDGSIDVAMTVYYLGDMLAKGIFSGIGKDIWEKVKQTVSSSSDKKALSDFESSPTQERNIAKIELLLENLIEKDEDFKSTLIELLRSSNKKGAMLTNEVNSSKNVVIGSSINIAQGNVHIGDGNAS